MKQFRSIEWAFLAVFLAAAGVRAIDLDRPADGTIRESWREADYAALARNFDREGMDILSPRIDWRGDGPGLAEMELPLVPWLTAALYRVFGVHEALGRLVSYLFALLGLLVFIKLARDLLPPSGALFAAGFYALAPLVIRVSNALQPESMMLFFILAAVASFRRWLVSGSKAGYVLALAATAGAVLAKAPAAHIGLLFVFMIIQARGWKALFKPSVLAFGFLALLPAAVWMVHAHRFWTLYGLSLGASNEAHWLGWDLLTHPGLLLAALARLVRMEALLSAMLPGLLLAPPILWFRRREPAARLSFFWLAAVGAYYLLAIRTTGDFWASYYHVASVAPFALVFGLAYTWLETRVPRPAPLRAAAAASFVVGTAIVVARAFSGLTLPSAKIVTAAVVAASVAAGLGLFLFRRRAEGERPAQAFRAVGGILTAAALLALFPLEGAQAANDLHPSALKELYECAVSFRPLIPEGELILVSGGRRLDETGKPVAYNASYFFYWLDRKGFSLPEEDQNLDSVAAFAERGASFFVLEDAILKPRPGFKEELLTTYALVAECRTACLFRLRPSSL